MWAVSGQEKRISNIAHLCSVAIAIPKVAWRYEYHRGNGRHRHYDAMHDVIQCIMLCMQLLTQSNTLSFFLVYSKFVTLFLSWCPNNLEQLNG